MRKQFLLFLKGPWMHTPAAAAQLDRMPQEQHFVIHQIFDRVPGNGRVIKDPADDNGVVGGIVMPQVLPRMSSAPCHLRSRHQPVEKTTVEIVENLLEMIVLAGGAVNAFSSAYLPDQ